MLTVHLLQIGDLPSYTEQLTPSAEEFSRGCYGAHFAPGVWTAYGEALRTPIGRIHWAGAEYATRWNGYMEGAVRSGTDAAREVLASLSAGAPTGT
jgi:monoamine oxidase